MLSRFLPIFVSKAFINMSVYVLWLYCLDLKRLLPSVLSLDPSELQKAIEVQLLRSGVSAMTVANQQPEHKNTQSSE